MTHNVIARADAALDECRGGVQGGDECHRRSVLIRTFVDRRDSVRPLLLSRPATWLIADRYCGAVGLSRPWACLADRDRRTRGLRPSVDFRARVRRTAGDPVGPDPSSRDSPSGRGSSPSFRRAAWGVAWTAASRPIVSRAERRGP